jgi:CHRD domain
MQRDKLIGAALCSGVFALWVSHAGAQEFTAHLTGFNEVGSIPTTFPAASSTTSPTGYTGAVLSDGRGTATLDLDKNAGVITYKLTYSDVGTTPPQTGMVSQGHIHFGKSRDSGGILVFFCTNLNFTGTGPTPQSCPTNSGTVTGTWTAMDVQAIAGQNVTAGNFEALVEALESNTAYANIHTVPLPGATNTAYPGGEIRGQVHRGDRDEKHHDHDNHEHN